MKKRFKDRDESSRKDMEGTTRDIKVRRVSVYAPLGEREGVW